MENVTLHHETLDTSNFQAGVDQIAKAACLNIMAGIEGLATSKPTASFIPTVVATQAINILAKIVGYWGTDAETDLRGPGVCRETLAFAACVALAACDGSNNNDLVCKASPRVLSEALEKAERLLGHSIRNSIDPDILVAAEVGSQPDAVAVEQAELAKQSHRIHGGRLH